MTMPTPPPDNRAAGQTGHIADHNVISDALAALETAVQTLENSSSDGAEDAVPSVFGRTGAVIAETGDYEVWQVTGAAPLASPGFSGEPTAPTPGEGDNSASIATTAFVATAVANGGGGGGGGGAVSSVFGRVGAILAESGDYSVAEVTGAAPLASPAFSGAPTAPTQTSGDSSAKLATTAFVAAAVADGSGFPVPSGTAAAGSVPAATGSGDATQWLPGLVFNVCSSSFAGGADPTGTSDSSAAVQAAVNAAVAFGGGTVAYPAGVFKHSAQAVSKNVLGTAVYIVGAGRWATTVKWYGAGDCFRLYDSTLWSSKTVNGGGIKGLTIDGAHTTGTSSAFHVGDIFKFEFDVAVQNFTAGTGSKGAWLDNNWNWTEQAKGEIYAQNCSAHVVFDNSANSSGVASGSFDRMALDLYIIQQGSGGGVGHGGDGVVFQNGALCANIVRLGIWGNFNTSTTQYAVLRVTGNNTALAGTDPGYSNLTQGNLYIGVELNDTNDLAPYTIYFGSSSNEISNCDGLISFIGSFASSNASGNFGFFGQVLGDPALTSSYGYFGSTAIFADGTNTVLSAPNITPTFANGTAAQLSDTTRDYEVYLQIGTAGTAFSLAIGPTSTPAVTLFSSATPAAGQLLHFRLPASWWVKWAGTSTTIAHQAAVGC